MEKVTSLEIRIPFDAPHIYWRKLCRKLFGVISLTPQGKVRGHVLLSYVTHPFTLTKKQLDASPHTNPWESLLIADIFLERGFAVDIIEWTNTSFLPKKKYHILIDIDSNLERLASLLPKSVKIYYATGSHWKYQNEAELKRLANVAERHGTNLLSRRQTSPNHAIEIADYATTLGNDFTKETFAFAKKEITQIPLLSTVAFPPPTTKEFSAITKNFVFISGGGAVHKGLDLVLEAFAALPQYHLTICGPVLSEKDFAKLYEKELSLPNITVAGRIDINGEHFKDIVNNAIGLVYPTCSEGQSGSVLTGLHAGLIPIVTRASGVDVEPFGIILEEPSVEEIRQAVTTLAHMPNEELQSRAFAAWNYAQKNHTLETFRSTYAAFIDRVCNEKNI